jgi:hypothetical protein
MNIIFGIMVFNYKIDLNLIFNNDTDLMAMLSTTI